MDATGSDPKEVRQATLEEAALLCDQLGDTEFAKIAKRGGIGIATLAQRHYMACATAIRKLRDGVPAS